MSFSSNRFILFFLIFVAIGAVLIGFVMFKYTHIKSDLKDDPLIQTKLGPIQGLWASDGNYSMFMGIPYAMVNESNPFGESIPYPEFNEVFKAYNDSAKCPQVEEVNHTAVGSLDCLHLNIYVPNSSNATNLLPVLVYIHGGSYEVGSAGRYLYGPKYFMMQDVILVVFNYRLGPYGFLCLNTPEVPGNQGLKDQIAALKWIKENIQSFGGDPKNVTLSGISSGGESVYLHLLFEKELLFDKAIIASGLTALPLNMNEANEDVPFAIAADLGLKTKCIHAALNYISTMDSMKVVQSSKRLNVSYKPCVERKFTNIEQFITNYTIEKLKVPNLKNISILLEQTSNEGLYLHANKDIKWSQYWYTFEDEINAQFDMDDVNLEKMIDYIYRFYIGDENLNYHVEQNVINFFSDLYFNYPTRNGIDRFLNNDARNVFYSIFSYVGERNYMRELHHIRESYNGTAHDDEIGYLFDISYMQNRKRVNDLLMVERMTTLWANFVKYGNPTPETTKLLPMKWKPVANNTYQYYNIDTEVSEDLNPFKERMEFWDLFYKLNGKFQRLVLRNKLKLNN